MSEKGEQKKEQQKVINSNHNSYTSEVASRFSLSNNEPNIFQNGQKSDATKAFEKTLEAINDSIKAQMESNNNLALKFDETLTSINDSIKVQMESNNNLALKYDEALTSINKSNANLSAKFEQTLTAINSSISVQNDLLSVVKDIIQKKISINK